MQRVVYLLQKLNDLSKSGDRSTLIEIDLMMDYTRVLYADLLDIKKKLIEPAPLAIFTQEPSQQHISSQAQHTQAPEQSTVQHTPSSQAAYTPPAQSNPPLQPASLPVQSAVTPPVTVPEAAPFDYKPSHSYNEPVPPYKPKKNIRQSIGINDKFLIISDLFHNNKNAYEETLDEINKLDTYRQALNWIDMNVSGKYQWDDENETVMLFQNILSNFFASI